MVIDKNIGTNIKNSPDDLKKSSGDFFQTIRRIILKPEYNSQTKYNTYFFKKINLYSGKN